MLKSREGQEGFTLIELLVVVLIIGILAAIAIPAFLGQKKGAQDSNAKSLLRNAAIAMESKYSDAQDFATVKADVTVMNDIEPNISWQSDTAKNDAKLNQIVVSVNGTNDGYALNTKSQSGTLFAWLRDKDAKTAKCKALTAAAAAPTAAAACPTGSAW